MASFRIKFPEKEEPTVIVLSGARITVGRLPHNTIQIVDRVVSSNHAELILDEGHYRLRDLGSTNGTFVNGQFVTDYHLREACQVAFGTVECEFSPETPAAGDTVEALPTRAEIHALKLENEDLKAQVAALLEELTALHQVRPVSGDEAALAVPKAEYERVTADREALREAQQRHHQEIARLKENLALLRRDRENLQRAWDITKAELNTHRPVQPSGPAPAETEAAPAPAEPAPKPTVLKAVPVASPPMARTPGSPVPSVPAPPAVGARPVPVARPAAAGLTTMVVKPTVVPNAGLKPVAKAPVAVPAPAKSTQKMDPVADAGATKPVPKVLPKPLAKLGSSAGHPATVAQTSSTAEENTP